MRIIVCLDDAADASTLAAARRHLEQQGFKPSKDRTELESLGLLVGEIPANRCGPLRQAACDGQLAGIVSIEPDREQGVQSVE